MSFGVHGKKANRIFKLKKHQTKKTAKRHFNKLGKSRLLSFSLVHFSVLTSLYMLNPAHADHLNKLLPQSQLDKIHSQYDAEIAQRFNAWDKLLLESKNKTTIEKLNLVNDFFNQMKWTDDQQLWKKRDYWATPIESMIRNAGDCEDFSIAKYFTLLELGVPIEQIKISYVKIIEFQQAHMVLAFYPRPDADPLILDNMNQTILPASLRDDLEPMFHFNDQGVWLEEQPLTRVDSVDKIRQWSDMIKRMDQEKI